MNLIKDENAYLKEQFLDVKDNSPMYGIYQIKQGSDYHFNRFTSFDTLIESGGFIERENYDFIYATSLPDDYDLDDIFFDLNNRIPSDFKGHSLSVSDIIVLKNIVDSTAFYDSYYIDSFDFQPVPDFLKTKCNIHDKEPTITIGYTESDYFYEGQQLPLSEANKLFEALDSNKYAETRGLYDKTDFAIDYVKDGKANHYEGRFDIGDGEGTLVSHIRVHAEYYLSAKGQQLLQRIGMEEVKKMTLEFQHIIDGFVPYLMLHNEITDLNQYIDTKLSEIFTTEQDRTKRAYYESLKEYIYSSRQTLNIKTGMPLPEFPNFEAINLTEQEREILDGYKQHIARLPIPISETSNQQPTKKNGMEM